MAMPGWIDYDDSVIMPSPETVDRLNRGIDRERVYGASPFPVPVTIDSQYAPTRSLTAANRVPVAFTRSEPYVAGQRLSNYRKPPSVKRPPSQKPKQDTDTTLPPDYNHPATEGKSRTLAEELAFQRQGPEKDPVTTTPVTTVDENIVVAPEAAYLLGYDLSSLGYRTPNYQILESAPKTFYSSSSFLDKTSKYGGRQKTFSQDSPDFDPRNIRIRYPTLGRPWDAPIDPDYYEFEARLNRGNTLEPPLETMKREDLSKPRLKTPPQVIIAAPQLPNRSLLAWQLPFTGNHFDYGRLLEGAYSPNDTAILR